MAFDTVINKQELEGAITATANAIREKTGDTAQIKWLADKGFADAVSAIQAGGSGGESSDVEWIGDGNTHIWATLGEGRTSLVIGIAVNGTATVDWGDGSNPSVITGTSVGAIKYTSNHSYASAGEYIITLTIDGEAHIRVDSQKHFALLRKQSSYTSTNEHYQQVVTKIEIGNSVTSIGNNAFQKCYSLTNISIPNSVTSIGEYAFQKCYSLTNISIPNSVTSIGKYAFDNCCSLTNISIPNSITSIGEYTFDNCYSLTNISIPNSVTSIGNNAFQNCHSLANISIPNSVTSIGNTVFYWCARLTSISIPEGVTSIGGNVFGQCYGMTFFDFSSHTAVPTLANTNAFTSIPADCEIRVPAALYDEWIAATNWSTYASNIVAV